MNIIRFKSFNNHFSVEIDYRILNDIKNECIKAGNNETGGILIGKYTKDNNTAIINSVTSPQSDSKQSRYIFERGISGLIKILENKWKAGQYYLGEWHSHPNLSPEPSHVDNKQMKELSTFKLLKCPEPILLVIGGNQTCGWKLSVHVYRKDNRITLLEVK